MRSYDVITFDCYGTLIDWEGGIAGAFAAAGAPMARPELLRAYAEIEPVVEAEAYRRYRDVLAECARRVGARFGWTPPDGGRFLAESLPEWQPFPDTNEALGRLRGAGFRLGILSNIDDDLLAATRGHFTVPFDPIVTAAQVGSYKPEHRHWQRARQELGDATWLHAAQSYFHDVVPARSLGIPTAWVNRKAERAPDGGKADLEVASLAELADRLC